jgi:hypothetical protein
MSCFRPSSTLLFSSWVFLWTALVYTFFFRCHTYRCPHVKPIGVHPHQLI